MPPGEYFLLASPQRLPNAISNGASTSSEVPTSTFYPGAVDTSAALPIVLRGGDEITGINIPIKTTTTSTISGKIIVSVPLDQVNTAVIQRGNVPAAIPSVMLARRERVGLDFGVGGGSSVFNPDDGTFVFRNVPSGSYVVVARLPVTANNGWGPGNAPERAGGPIAFGRTAVAVNGADVKDVSVVIHKGVDLKGILIVDGRPASANVRISLQSDDGENPALYRTARTDAQGHFIINTVPPGTYSLFAWESVLAGAWQSAEFLRTFADRGVPVSVSAAERANVNVGIIKERQ
jgi:hypothetical protein